MGILELLALVLFVFWVGGLFFHIAGGIIHFLLIASIILFVFRFIRRKAV